MQNNLFQFVHFIGTQYESLRETEDRESSSNPKRQMKVIGQGYSLTTDKIQPRAIFKFQKAEDYDDLLIPSPPSTTDILRTNECETFMKFFQDELEKSKSCRCCCGKSPLKSTFAPPTNDTT